MPELIIITGSPGTGKTTVSSILSNKLGFEHIELSRFSKENGLIIGEDDRRSTGIVDITGLFKVLDDVIRNRQGPVILDGHYAHDYKPKIDDAIVFVLRRAPWVLYEELEERGYAMKKVWENIESEIMGICSNEARENHDIVCEIDTTKLSLKEITASIQRIIEEKDSCPTEQIDWLTCSRTIDLMKEGR